MLQILGASALLLSVGCQKPGTEDSADKDTTDKKSPVKVVITPRGPRVRVRVPRKRKPSTEPSATADTPEPSTEDAECVVKGNVNSKGRKLYHVADGCPDYDAVKINRKGEKCFDSEEEARAAGWKKAGNCK